LDPRDLDEGPRTKSDKLRLNLHGTCFEGKINQLRPKNRALKGAHDLKNQDASCGPRQDPTQGFNFASKLVPMNLDFGAHLKWALLVSPLANIIRHTYNV
jgi:hypothetical protein